MIQSCNKHANTNIPISVGLHFIQQSWSGNPELAWITHYISLHNQTPTHLANYRTTNINANTNIPVSVGLHFIQQIWSGIPKLARNIPSLEAIQINTNKLSNLGISSRYIDHTTFLIR